MSTGYTAERAAFHEIVVPYVAEWLRLRGHRVEILDVVGHRPDMLVDDSFYVDAKTRYQKHRDSGNFTIELNSVQAYRYADRPVMIVWIDEPVLEPFSDVEKRLGELRPPTGNGSRDDFYLVPVWNESTT